MEIWIIHTDTQSGTEIGVYYSQEEANAFALKFCADRWDEDEDGQMPEDWTKAYEVVSEGSDWITLEHHTLDLSKLFSGVSLPDLMRFGDCTTDSDGNPCVWLNRYECGCGETWDDRWSCQCNDRCPSCDAECEPIESVFCADVPNQLAQLWEAISSKQEAVQ